MSMVGLDSMVNQAWSLIMDKFSGSIAILGDGGAGKTTLMKILYNKLIGTKHFETVIWITVSSNLTLEKIQDDIARSMKLLDAKWVRKSSDEKSELIRSVLAEKKSVLLCLDDVWDKLILSGLGHDMALKNWGSNCTLIFTTGSRQIAESARRVLLLDELVMEDALRLFRRKLGEEEGDGKGILSDRRISDLARVLVRRSEGLPIILCTVGRAMARRKTYEDWIDAVEEIDRNDRELGTEIHPNYLLKFCFDSLPDRRIKSCLLYFSLFPEDCFILRNDLIDFWICEEILDYYDALNSGYDAIDELIDAGLLEQEHHNVCMLDMIREFCLYIVIESQVFNRARLVQPTDSVKLETVGWISPFLRTLENVIPEILFAFMLCHNPFVMIRGRFSEFMDALTVLNLSESGVEEVPREISRLVSLQYLDLSNNWIEQLPIELKMLAKLRCLNLEHDEQLRVMPKQILYSLSSLRVLKMFRCGYSVEKVKDNLLSVTNIDIDPLLCLKHLQVLSITVTSESALDKMLNNRKLLSCIQSLSLEVFWDSKLLNVSCFACMNRLLTLEIHQAENVEGFSLEVEHSELLKERSFERLQEVTIEKCSSLQEVTWVITIPNVRILRVQSCDRIEGVIGTRQYGEIWKRSGEEVGPIFAKLEVLVLHDLPELKIIYWETLSFPCLKRLEVKECFLLKKLPLNSKSAKKNELMIEGEEDWWNHVQWEDDDTKTAFVPCFKPLLV